MVTTVHLLAGMTIGALLKQPVLVVPIAFCTHYLLDAIPHYAPKPVIGFKDGGIKGMSIKDLLIKSFEPLAGVLLVLIFVNKASNELVIPIILGAIFGWLPDFFVYLEWKHNIKRPWPFRGFEIRTHKHTGGLRGILPQVFVAIASILITLAIIR